MGVIEATIFLFVCNMQAEKKARIRQDKLEKGAAKAAEELEKCKFSFIFSCFRDWHTGSALNLIGYLVFSIHMNPVLTSLCALVFSIQRANIGYAIIV